jgi:hypothetical protein
MADPLEVGSWRRDVAVAGEASRQLLHFHFEFLS